MPATSRPPGHISSGKEQLMISGDDAYVPALYAADPGRLGVFDQAAVVAKASRRKLLDRVIADKMMICGSHSSWPGLGKIARDGAGYALSIV
jgi:glyoxylase-like metal-dependent hydrolase (beta-lactamase superfamily II)